MGPSERRLYIKDRLHTDWGWEDWQKGPLGLSYADIVARITGAFGETFSRSTIMRDIDVLREAALVPTSGELTEAQRLLLPENFPQWRAKLFPGYETPEHQFAAFWVMYALLYKVAIPDWVIEYLDYMDPERPLPPDLNELIIAGDRFITFEFLMAPRHGKTDLTLHFIIHTHCNDPSKEILWGNGTLQKTSQFAGNFLLPILEHHEELNRLYGPFYNPGNWSKTLGYIVAKREGFSKMPSLMPFGLGGSVRSFDTDLIIGDDLSDYKRALNERVTEQDAEWFVTELMQRRQAQTPVFNLGSHLPIDTGDFFVHVEERLAALQDDEGSLVIVKKIPAHDYNKCDGSGDHENCVIWPSLQPYKKLETRRKELNDDTMFEAVFNQKPMSTEMMHFPHDILRTDFEQVDLDDLGIKTRPEQAGILDRERSWKAIPKCCKKKEVLVAAGFDPAISEDKRASYSAVAVLGACPYCGRRYPIDYFQTRQSPELHPQLLDSFLTAFPAIVRLRIENNAYQKALARDPRMDEIADRNKVWIDEWRTDERKWDPALGVPQMGRHFKNGMWSVPYQHLSDQEYAEDLIKTFLRWPKRPNDLVMAFWLAELSLLEMIEEYRSAAAEMMPGTERYRTPWHDEITYSVDLADIETEPGEWEYV